MKKHTSQIFLAIVCGFLGFLLAYQFRMLAFNNKNKEKYNNKEMLSEIETLKKANEELTKEKESLAENLKKIEDEAKEDGDISRELTSQLEQARMQLGTETVKGSGIIVTLNPKSSVFANNVNDSAKVNDEQLINLTNVLWYARAEAISINDYRITSQTGIKNSGNYIWIGSSERINPEEKIIIKVIGDKTKLQVGLTWQDAAARIPSYDVNIEESDDITIEKSNQAIRNDYIKPVKE